MSTAVFSSQQNSGLGAPSPFPGKTALAIAVAVAVLLGWHLWRNRTQGFSPGIFRDAATFRLPHPPRATATPASAGETAESALAAKASGSGSHSSSVPSISALLIDDSRALDPFFASLWRLEERSAGPAQVVTILHYGDSPTTADLITGDARAMLQARFGDAGHGFNLVGKPWAWYGHRDVDISDHGWHAFTGVGSMRQGIYGLGGATLVGNSDAHSAFRLTDGGRTTVAELQYLSEPNGGSVTLSADGTQVLTISTEGDPDNPAFRAVSLPTGTRSVELTVSGGQVKLLGLDLRTGRSGVLYDSLGLNGASTTVLSRTFAPGPWAAALRHAAPALVIINYGTNESGFGSFVHKQYEGELRLAIGKLRSALPDVPILIMSPMDRAERAGLNEIRTMPAIPEIVAIQRRVAADTHCGFFDTFHAMGGDGTMARWFAAKPRLVAADFIHPTPQGALTVARLLVANLDLGYDRWKRLNGIAVDGTRSEPLAPPASVAQEKAGERSTGPPAGSSSSSLPGVSPGTTTPSPGPRERSASGPSHPGKPSAAVPESPIATAPSVPSSQAPVEPEGASGPPPPKAASSREPDPSKPPEPR